jgi:hypothetical protein
MYFVNYPNVRIQKYKKGFVVEIESKKWYGKKYWKHIISVAGIENEPWYFSSYEFAILEAQKYFKWNLLTFKSEYNGKSNY